MPKPRVFVSSTFYDLRYVRSSLEGLIDSLGFEPILSEKGAVTYMPDLPLDESCYQNVSGSDILVLIIGGRYGSPTSKDIRAKTSDFYGSYESITRAEYRMAVERDIPIYILIEASVYSEFDTFLRNRENSSITYAHVQSVNVFHFVDEILKQPRNNPVCKFQGFVDIELYLRQQWAGLFHELLRRRTEQRQISSLSARISELEQLNRTLKTYLEAMMTQIKPDESKELIQQEEGRLREVELFTEFIIDPYWNTVSRRSGKSLETLFALAKDAPREDDFVLAVLGDGSDADGSTTTEEQCATAQELLRHLGKLKSEFH